MKKYAVIVGINYYKPGSGITTLNYACRDAENVKKILCEECEFEMPALCLSDGEERQTGNQEIFAAIKNSALNIGPEDLFLFYFSGHGIHIDGKGYLLTTDSFIGGFEGATTNALSLDVLIRSIRRLSCRNAVIILDGCRRNPFAGQKGEACELEEPFARDVEIIIKANPLQTHRQSLHLLLGCSVGQQTWEDPALKEGIFTHTLIEGLRGPAENEKNCVTVQSLFGYCKKRIPELCRRIQGRAFEPSLFSAGEDFNLRENSEFKILSEDPIIYYEQDEKGKDIYCTGGKAPFRWEVRGLPAGITAVPDHENSRILTFAGRPQVYGESDITVTAAGRDDKQATQNITLKVPLPEEVPPLRIVTEELGAGFVGQRYSASVQCEGGRGPYRWDIAPLPEGLRVIHETEHQCLIEGVPEREEAARITLRVSDSSGRTAAIAWPIPLTILDKNSYCEIPAGSFKAGYHETPERNRELAGNGISLKELKETFPPCELTLPAFAIRKYPVTNREYYAYLEATGFQSIPHGWKDSRYPENEEDFPVTGIRYEDAQGYCRWKGTRLPTSAKWEKAARGIDGRLYPWGDQFAEGQCNTQEAKVGKTVSVKTFNDASPYGVRQLAGNIWEYVDGGRALPVSEGGYVIGRRVRGSSYRNPGVFFGMACVYTDEYIRPTVLYDDRGLSCRNLEDCQDLTDTGFRDCVDLSAAEYLPQALVNIAGRRIEQGRIAGGFSMARYAVSNQEYYEFVQATGHRRPPHWADGELPYPYEQRHRPVVNVSLSDAESFCRWKTQQLIRQGVLTPESSLHLPSELQWQAAFGGRTYPWGPVYESWRCNSVESGWARPVRVFELEEGATPEGIRQLAGNVYEWLISGEKIAGGSWRCEYGCQRIGKNSGLVPIRSADGGDILSNEIGFRYCGPVVAQETL